MAVKGITQEQVSSFHENGYLLIPDFLDQETVKRLRGRIVDMLDTFDVSNHPMTKFTTGDDNQVGDDYFLNSNDKVRFFFEEGAFDKNGKLIKEKSRSINKIGHALHELDPEFRQVTINENTRAIAKALDYEDPRVLQSMVILKQPEIGGEVPSHADSTFLYTKAQTKDAPGPSAIGFWFALEDCTRDNGCLSFVPGSHLTTPISKRFVKFEKGGTGFEPIEGAKPHVEPPPEAFALQECPAGTLVLIHGTILHKSSANLSQKSRHIYTFHMIETGKGNIYDEKNWLAEPEGGFTSLR